MLFSHLRDGIRMNFESKWLLNADPITIKSEHIGPQNIVL